MTTTNATASMPSNMFFLTAPSLDILKPISTAYNSLPTLEISEICMIWAPVIAYWTYSSFLYVLSYFQLTSVELHRIPTDQKMRPPNRITVMLAYVFAVVGRPEGMNERSMEHPFMVVAKLCAAAVMLDSYQYWMHRWMHTNRWLYRKFHSVHHELTVLYAFGALYNHPVEGFLMDSIGGGVPSLILDMHPWTATIFFTLATLKTVDDHCGYALPWDPLQRLFRNNAEYHDIHHWGKGRMYNFSQPFFTFWDIWMGTDYELEMKKQAKKKAQSGTSRVKRISTARSPLGVEHEVDPAEVPTCPPSAASLASSNWSVMDSGLGSSDGGSDTSCTESIEGDETDRRIDEEGDLTVTEEFAVPRLQPNPLKRRTRRQD
ncbi:fatty acid hydroxylase superfamily-domain-containing protein [Gaertneriomyces semiglobifer]|nr:fatty acid hydroxylase superfamily-domain-containing protein [Gaertneriomyces semiglobifer]